MNGKLFLAAAVGAAVILQVPAQAQRAPSAHVRCDGNPDNVSAGETVARLLGAVTLLGVFAPPPEAPDHSQRLSGADGVAICNQALSGESNDVRRAQLILATAIHHIEAGDPDAAIAEARRATADRPELAASPAFRHTLALVAMDVEAMALVAAGRIEEAQAKAFEMAAAAPYDLVTSVSALRYVLLTRQWGEAQERYFDNLVRLFPPALLSRAAQRQLAGDFAGSAADYALWREFERSLTDEPVPSLLAQAALASALAGENEDAEALAERARTAVEAAPTTQGAQNAGEILDLYRIWALAQEGRVADARLLFAARTTWKQPTAAAVSAVARRLQQGAEPGQLSGSLAGDPDRWINEQLERRREAFVGGKSGFDAIRPFYAPASYERFARNVWRDGRSRYFARDESDRLHARLVNVTRDGWGTPAGYALLLHAALTAQREGRTHFMLVALRPAVGVQWVRTGNSGDESLVGPLSFEAARVVADLRPMIPPPPRR